jgi:hypothetical protein
MASFSRVSTDISSLWLAVNLVIQGNKVRNNTTRGDDMEIQEEGSEATNVTVVASTLGKRSGIRKRKGEYTGELEELFKYVEGIKFESFKKRIKLTMKMNLAVIPSCCAIRTRRLL